MFHWKEDSSVGCELRSTSAIFSLRGRL